MWKCDRDGSMFENKKDADAYDKMLELGEQFTALLEACISGIDEVQAEAFGILLAKNKELLVQACRGNPDALKDINRIEKVTPISDAVGS
jgi:dsDNA-binding SOS-regulon protein